MEPSGAEPPLAVGVPEPVRPSPLTVGERLKQAREARGITLVDLADRTKVSRRFLVAIEEGRLDKLPSRPFAIGYVRAYAEALGLDADALVSRFRTEAPEGEAALAAPVGVGFQDKNRLSLIGGALAAAAVAIVLFNVVQRAMTLELPQAEAGATAAEPALGALPGPVLAIGAATPPPAEQTIPAAYITPGLEAAYAAVLSGQPAPDPNAPAAAVPTAAATPATEAVPPPPETFNPSGAVYGAAPQSAMVVLQARDAATVIVRDRTGAIHFARALSRGEAYRAAATPGLSVEVSDPSDVWVFVDGQPRGLMPAASAPLEKLAALKPAVVVR